MAKIVDRPKDGNRRFTTTTKNTDLASCVGATEVYRAQSARGGYFYEVQAPGFICFQSATNTILELSRKLKNI